MTTKEALKLMNKKFDDELGVLRREVNNLSCSKARACGVPIGLSNIQTLINNLYAYHMAVTAMENFYHKQLEQGEREV